MTDQERIADLERQVSEARINRHECRVENEKLHATRLADLQANLDLTTQRDTLRGLLREAPEILTRCRRFMSVDNEATTTDQEEYQRTLADSYKWRERITAALKGVEG